MNSNTTCVVFSCQLSILLAHVQANSTFRPQKEVVSSATLRQFACAPANDTASFRSCDIFRNIRGGLQIGDLNFRACVDLCVTVCGSVTVCLTYCRFDVFIVFYSVLNVDFRGS